MQSITFECEVITPMFLAGADGTTPELRAPSIKGALRFWWRAMNGHLSLDELKKKEGDIFGNTDHRSAFTIQIIQQELQTEVNDLVPHKGMKQKSFAIKQSFKIKFTILKAEIFDIQKVQSLFELVVCLGGFGKRSRRGMGGIKILNSHVPKSTEDILKLIRQHSNHYNITGDSIRNTYQGRMQPYGWIKQIQIGKPKNQAIPKTTSHVTHELHQKYREAYEPNLGHAFKGRFASPVIVSVLGDDKTPIITTLNTVPDRGNRDLDIYIQDDFKSKIL